jgi:signal transduction histidine kinase
MSPIYDTSRGVVGVSASARDITDRKQAERELHMAEFGKLASGLVHEIRNPLNAMRMQIAVIRGKLQRPGEENLALATDQLSKLEREVLRVTNLATDFLAYGRPGPDKVEDFDVADVLRDVADFVRPEFEEAGWTVTCNIPAEPAGLPVRMDSGKLRQVLLNLAENARQSVSQAGQLEFAGRRITDREMQILVADTGPGIPEDTASQIFEPFFSTKEGGTGLGLAIVKRTVESAGGRVGLVRRADRGACFDIRLPSPGEGPHR